MLTLKRWGVVTLVFAVVIACALPAVGDERVWTSPPGGELPDYPLLRLAMESMDEDWDDAEDMTLLATAFQALAKIPPDARLAFAQAYSLDIETVNRAYYRLLSFALYAEIRLYPATEEANRITQERLMALLSNDEAAREALTEAAMVELTTAYNLPMDFLQYLATARDYTSYDRNDWDEAWDGEWHSVGEGHYKGRGVGHDKDGDGIDDHKGVTIRENGGKKNKKMK